MGFGWYLCTVVGVVSTVFWLCFGCQCYLYSTWCAEEYLGLLLLWAGETVTWPVPGSAALHSTDTNINPKPWLCHNIAWTLEWHGCKKWHQIWINGRTDSFVQDPIEWVQICLYWRLYVGIRMIEWERSKNCCCYSQPLVVETRDEHYIVFVCVVSRCRELGWARSYCPDILQLKCHAPFSDWVITEINRDMTRATNYHISRSWLTQST